MRLYTPAKPSTSLGDDGATRPDLLPREDRTYNFDSRSTDLTDRAIENDPRLDERLQINAPRIDDKTQLNLARLDDKLHLNGPLREEQLPSGSARNPFIGVEVNGVSQNGPQALNHDAIPHENGSDTLRSLDSVPWNLDGTQTIIENGSRSGVKNGSVLAEENGQESHISLEEELKQHREENKRLKAALSEAAEVNSQWRQYHDERQTYVQRLLTTIHELQHAQPSAHSPRQLDGEGSSSGGQEAEVRRLRESMARMQADHEEHVQLLEMQVRAHRDDWEAERSEKRAAQTSLAEAEARTALLLQELQLLQAKLADTESKRGLCWRCLLPRTDFSNRSSRGSSASRSAQASPVPAPNPGGPTAPPASGAPPSEAPPAPLKGWIPVSMLHQIAFSGATPEHQTPVVHAQPRAQPSSRLHQQGHQHPATTAKSTPATQSSLGRTAEKGVTLKQETSAPQVGPAKPEESKVTPTTGNVPSTECKTGNVTGVADEKKKYEAMGARPKVLGNLQPLSGKGVGLIEDEKTAKHRARSILASAIPVSPVSSGPPTPCGSSLTRSPSTPNMPKGYMPITSTILTPINFRQPFVAHKRPSTMKQITQAVQAATQAAASSSARARSETSPSTAGVHTDTSAARTQSPCNLSALSQAHSESLIPSHSRSDSSPASIGLSCPPSGCNVPSGDNEMKNTRSNAEKSISPTVNSSKSNANSQNGANEAKYLNGETETNGGKETVSPGKSVSKTDGAPSSSVKQPLTTTTSSPAVASDASTPAANSHPSKSPSKTVASSNTTKTANSSSAPAATPSTTKAASSNTSANNSSNAKAATSTDVKTTTTNISKIASNNVTSATSSGTTVVASKNTMTTSSCSTTTATSVTTTSAIAKSSVSSTTTKTTAATNNRNTAVTSSSSASTTASKTTAATSTTTAVAPKKTTAITCSNAVTSTKNASVGKSSTVANTSSATDITTVSSNKSTAVNSSKAVTNTGGTRATPSGTVTTSNTNVTNCTHKNSTAANTSVAPALSSASNNSTAFASITVTTTAAGGVHPASSASTYSSATSSRSSSPGVSLTTFGLNSEGRGIPGAICFALRPEQNGIRSPQPCPSSRGTSTSSVKSPTPDSVSAGQSYRQTLPPSGVKSPPIVEHPSTNTVKEEHWWSVESPGRSSTPGRQHGGKLVNSTWVRLMGGQANNRQSSGLPWRTARAVSGQQLDQARRASHEDSTSGPTSPNSMSSTATFNYTPAVNSPPSSNLSSATNSAATSPLPSVNQRPNEDLRTMASKNISSAIMSYELGNKCDPLGSPVGVGGVVGSQGWPTQGGDVSTVAPNNDGVATMTRRDLVCPSCQMLFPPEKHLQFLDHFEVCRGPEYADL